MTSTLFLTLLALGSAAYLFWGFRTLPREHWKIMAAVPTRRWNDDGRRQGTNLTWYGVFSANAYLAAVWLFLLLTGALRLPGAPLGLFIATLLGLCVPAASLVARLVEKKAHTLTVGGAVFVGLVASPCVLLGCNVAAAAAGLAPLPVLPVLAALGTAYAFGEGLGRLACLSFGCCYGKPLKETPTWLLPLFERFAVRFFGATKKIAYAGHLEGERVLPVQALTALLCVATALTGCALFLGGYFAAAFVLSVIVTQGWRVASEFLRADFRGTGRLTAYQWMGLTAIPYALALVALAPAEPVALPVVANGLAALWTPGLLLALQGLWLLIFFFTGRSAVTAATLSFHVRKERI
jgi:hypothetical protein